MDPLCEIEGLLLSHPLGQQIQVGTGIADRAHVGTTITQCRDRVGVCEQGRDNLGLCAGARDVDQVAAIIAEEEIVEPFFRTPAFASGARGHVAVRRGQVFDGIFEGEHQVEALAQQLDENMGVFVVLGENLRFYRGVAQSGQALRVRQPLQGAKARSIAEGTHGGRMPHQHAHRPGDHLPANIQPLRLSRLEAFQLGLPQLRVPVHALTGRLDRNQRERALGAGCPAGFPENIELVVGIHPVRNELHHVSPLPGQAAAKRFHLAGRRLKARNVLAGT